MPKSHITDSSKTITNDTFDLKGDKIEISNILAILDAYQLKTNPFGSNLTGENSYRRAERICAALHLITNHIQSDEPLRTSARDAGLRLLNKILEFRNEFRATASEKGQSVLAEIRGTISLVRLLVIAGYISMQNANAVIEALDELGSLILVSERSRLAEQVILSRGDLTPPAHTMFAPKDSGMISRIGQRAAKKDLIKHVKDDMVGSGGVERGNQIMDILRAGGVLGIKDITSNLPQYSEKMVQRELANLVQLQRVEKTGEKRWSRYRAA